MIRGPNSLLDMCKRRRGGIPRESTSLSTLFGYGDKENPIMIEKHLV